MAGMLEGKVAIVTGAGGGIGRAIAVAMGQAGAKVLVNDIGASLAGEGRSQTPAEETKGLIEAAGGSAAINTDSVAEWASAQKIVQAALDHFGRLDVVVNNAGILRDASFAKMSEEDWDLIYRVHLLGSMRVTKAAWPHMRSANFGRVIMTTSVSGIYGNFGQANYSAMKLGLVGLAKTLAIEGVTKNINVNALGPTAGSRLTATVLPKNVIETLKPEYVTPAVVLLTHESSTVTGRLFEVGGGWICETRWEQTQGAFFRDDFSAEDLAARWDEATSFENARHATKVSETKNGMVERLGKREALSRQ